MSKDNPLNKLYKKAEEETTKEVGDKIANWRETINTWIRKWEEILFLQYDPDVPVWFVKPLIWAKETTFLFRRRGIELFKNLYWIQKCVMSGAYHQAIREFRYSLEMMIQSYYLDTKYPIDSLEKKMETLQDLEPFPKKRLTGGKIIEKTDLDNKGELRTLYLKFCKFVHPTLTEIQSQSPEIEFNEDLFNECVDLSYKFMKAINEVIEKWKEVVLDYWSHI
jgi:hypothetical protein